MVPPVQFPRYLNVHQDLSFGILIVLFLGAVGRLWGPGPQISCCHCIRFGGWQIFIYLYIYINIMSSFLLT